MTNTYVYISSRFHYIQVYMNSHTIQSCCYMLKIDDDRAIQFRTRQYLLNGERERERERERESE